MKLLQKNALHALIVLVLAMAGFSSQAEGHAFPVRSTPRVGWTVATSPPEVRIWFNEELQPAFSTIVVYNSAGQRVDKNNSRVSASDSSVLEVDLPALPPGVYRVYWKVISIDRDGTEGDFSFTIGGKAQ